MNSQVPAPETLSTEEFRQRLAGLIDPEDTLDIAEREALRFLALDFLATLPELFGEELDRMTLWDRIGSAVETAFAKTVGADAEYFVSQVLDHIKAESGAAARNDRLADVLLKLDNASNIERQQWITYLKTHLVPLLVHARSSWEANKTQRKAKRKGGKT